MRPATRLVLFDLDGTLADTAPDLTAAANGLRTARGLSPLPYETLRPMASHGARGLVGRALGLAPGHAGFDAAREEFLDGYQRALCVHSRLFDGVPELLDDLDRTGIVWGVVTNKIARFAEPLVAALGLRQRAACLVSGDSTPHAKPHPAPLLHALSLCKVPASEAVYVGDDLRDMQAGRAAGLRVIAAAYGYIADGDADVPLAGWPADHVIAAPADLRSWLGLPPWTPG